MQEEISGLPEPVARAVAGDPALGVDGEFVVYLHQILERGAPEAGDAGSLAPLLRALASQRRGLVEARARIEEMAEINARLVATPWRAATFVRVFQSTDGVPRALVLEGSRPCAVGFARGIDPAVLRLGEGVFLSQAGNVILSPSPIPLDEGGETAAFSRLLPDGRVALRWQEGEIVVRAAAGLETGDWRAGDLVRFDRNLWLARERLEGARRSEHRIAPETLAGVSRAQIGGQKGCVTRFFEGLRALTAAPERARRYNMEHRPVSILLHGPPGNGKTTLARVGAAELQGMLGERVSLYVVQPSGWVSSYVGQTEANIREFFARVREVAETQFALIYIDEVESIGRIRGSSGSTGHHHDRFLASLLAELDGFLALRNCGVIASTNRVDMLDAGLRDRLGDIQIEVGAPAMADAREIFAVHLPGSILYNPNGADADATREEAIESALSALYSPNADNAVATVRLRDGKERPVTARDMVSGRTISQICKGACRRALNRDLSGGDPGLTVEDVEVQVRDAIRAMRATLTLFNAYSYLPDLPYDIGIAEVIPVSRRAARPAIRRLAAA